jgi:hypothetical protein
MTVFDKCRQKMQGGQFPWASHIVSAPDSLRDRFGFCTHFLG